MRRLTKKWSKCGCKVRFISGITYYEVKRELLATNATRKLLEFDVSGVVRFFDTQPALSGDIEEGLCRRYRVLPVLNEIEVLEKASEIHADLKRQGRRLEDADILIAATAIARGIILVSHDTDMQRVTGIAIEDWLES
ncbi:MAG: PIN domain-containing protein [Hormoscilla sp. GUM202]|nr:PIN domain-containing protein [Hormoscilla sp. GUM202]